MLGSLVESALTKAGLTADRIERWLGKPCHCKERKEKLDQLTLWAKQSLKKCLSPASAKRFLDQLIR